MTFVICGSALFDDGGVTRWCALEPGHHGAHDDRHGHRWIEEWIRTGRDLVEEADV